MEDDSSDKLASSKTVKLNSSATSIELMKTEQSPKQVKRRSTRLRRANSTTRKGRIPLQGRTGSRKRRRIELA